MICNILYLPVEESKENDDEIPFEGSPAERQSGVGWI
jgi:hypothetical protein